jgi:SWI/SNF-related matrix-associated actin-dependent regulator of chromatin subfamily A-like protein 1
MPVALFKTRTIESTGTLGVKLYGFQKEGVDYGLARKKVIIGDDMGTGKTIQALAIIDKADAYPALIITPASNKLQWAQVEIPKVLPGRRVCLAEKYTGAIELQFADIIVTNYEQLTTRRTTSIGVQSTFTDTSKKTVILSPMAEALQRLNLQAIVLDESHSIKSSKAARTRACMELRKNIPYRILLTGTPILNRPAELVQPLRFLDTIEKFGGSWKFLQRYCGLTRGRFGWEAKGCVRGKELNLMLKNICYIRRTKSEVLAELPPKTRVSYLIEITNRKEYNEAKSNFLKWIKENAMKDPDFVKTLEGLSEMAQQEAIRIYVTDKMWKAQSAMAMVQLAALRKLAAKGKIQAAIEWIKNFLETEQSLVVFAMHKHTIAALREAFPQSACIVSEQDAEERQKNVRAFQEGKYKLLIGAMGTSAQSSPAGVGHTLTAATNVLFTELGWTPGHLDQCEDRCHRIGTKDNVTCHYLLGDKTIDVKLASLIEAKRKVVHQVLDGKDVDGKGIMQQVLSAFLTEEMTK